MLSQFTFSNLNTHLRRFISNYFTYIHYVRKVLGEICLNPSYNLNNI